MSSLAGHRAQYLKIGDVISLCSDDGYFVSEGLTDIRCRCKSQDRVSNIFFNCLFRVHPKHNYSAKKELDKLDGDRRSSLDAGQRRLLYEFLQDNERSEREVNEETFQKMTGSVVSYGQVIQLQHVKSGQFVSVKPRSLSELEKECVRVELDDGGSEGSWFTIMPRYKVRSEGDRVFLRDQVLFMGTKWNQYLHVSRAPFQEDESLREVNASFEITRWRLSCFSDSTADNTTTIRAGDVVRLLHPETEGYLVAEDNEAYLLQSAATKELVNQREPKLSTATLWVVERGPVGQGGACEFAAPLCFRHLLTGRYLITSRDEITLLSTTDTIAAVISSVDSTSGDDAQSEEKIRQLGLTDDRLSPNIVFTASPTAVLTTKQIEFGVSLRLQQDGFTVHSTRDLGTSVSDGSVRVPSALEAAVSPRATGAIAAAAATGSTSKRHAQLRTNVVTTSKFYDEDAFRVVRASKEDVADVHFLQSALPVLQHYLSTLATGRRASGQETSLVISVIEQLIFFVTQTEDSDAITCEGLPIRKRQKLFRELKLFDVLADVLRAPFRPTADGKPAPYDISMIEKRHHDIFRIIRLVYRLIYHGFKQYFNNEMYCAVWIPDFIAQLGYNLLATNTLTELLNNNRQLLDKTVNMETIKIFVDFLRKEPKQRRYTRFLTALCSCSGVGISSNQEDVCDVVFKDKETFEDVLIHTKLNDEGTVLIRWKENGQKWVSLEDLAARFKEEKQNTLTRMNIKSSSGKSKLQMIMDFYESQISLFAEMCLDRNYKVFKVLEDSFSRRLVFECMKASSGLPPNIRSAFTRLMLHLHVDRDEQEIVHAPNLTRVWGDLRDALPHCSDPNKFHDLEEFIAGYFETCKGVQIAAERQTNLLTLSVLTLLKFLVLFGFYGTIEEIEQVVRPLVDTLDGRNDRMTRYDVSKKKQQQTVSRGGGTFGTAAASSSSAANAAPTPKGYTELQPIPSMSTSPSTTSDSRKRNVSEGKQSTAGTDDGSSSDSSDSSDESDSDSDDEGALHGVRRKTPARYKHTESNLLIMQAKTEMCKILLRVADLRQDYRLSKILMVYRDFVNSGKPLAEIDVAESFDHIFTSKEGRRLDMDEMTPDTPLNTVLLDLMMYEYDDLVSSALNLFIRSHSQRSVVLQALGNTQLLVSSQSVSVFKEVQQAVSSLRTVAETTELWLKDPTLVDENCEKIITTVQGLARLCVDDIESGILTENQLLLSNAGVHHVVIDILKIPYTEKLFQAFDEVYKFMTVLIKDNTSNQIHVYKHLDLLLSQTAQIPSTTAAITEIFSNNSANCWNVQESFIRHWFDMIESHGPSSEYLRPVMATICVGNRAIKRNQNMALKVLMEPHRRKNALIVFANDSGYQRRMQLMGDPLQLADPRSELNYHLTLLDLLAMSSKGQNYICEAICQSLLTVDEIIAAILDHNTIQPVRRSLVLFLNEVYLDTETEYPGLKENLTLLEMLGSLCEDVIQLCNGGPDEYVTRRDSDPDFMRYIFGAAIPAIASYFEYIYSVDFVTENEEDVIQKLVSTVVAAYELLDNARTEEPGHRNSVATCLLAMGAKDFPVPNVSVETVAAETFKPARSLDMHDSTAVGLVSFWRQLSRDDEVQDSLEDEFKVMVSHIKKCEEIHSPHIRFDPLVRKLIRHVQTLVNEGDSSLSVKTLRIFTAMVYKEPEVVKRRRGWRKNDDDDDDDDDDEPEADPDMQRRLDKLGASNLVIQLVKSGGSVERMKEAFRLGIALLEGGNAHVQRTMYQSFVRDGHESFFMEIRELMRRAIDVVKQRKMQRKRADDDDDDDNEGEQDSGNVLGLWEVMRFLQLLCEGHNNDLQNYLRVQTSSKKSYDLVSETVTCLIALEKASEPKYVDVLVQSLDSLVEYVQGPCIENQTTLVGTKLLETANRIIRGNYLRYDADKVRELKTVTLKALVSLLEGRSDSLVFDRLTSALDFKSLGDRLVKVYNHMREEKEKARDTVDDSELEYDLMSEGFELFILIQTLATLNPDLVEKATSGAVDSEAFLYYKQRVGHVEVVREGELAHVYFRIPRMCKFLTPKSKNDLLWGVNRDSPSEKLTDFFDRADDLILEMKHQDGLFKNKYLSFLARNLEQFKTLSFYLAVIINLLLIWRSSVPDTEDLVPARNSDLPQPGFDDISDVAIQVLGTMQLVFAFFIAAFYALNYGPLLVKSGWKDKQTKAIKVAKTRGKPGSWRDMTRRPKSAYGEVKAVTQYGRIELFSPGKVHLYPVVSYYTVVYVMRDPLLVFYALYFLASVLARTVSPFFNAFHLFDVVARNETLKNVIKSVTHNGRQLLMTGLLGFLMIYILAIFGHLFFRGDYLDGDTDEYTCDSLAVCFVTTLMKGLFNDGGVGGYLEVKTLDDNQWFARIIYDLLYFILVLTILLNIIFGIIIDTFADLRNSNKEKLEDMQTRCFICNIDRYSFDRRAPGGFENHIKNSHNMWVYLYFIAYIDVKDPTEYTGLESYVAELVARRDTSWFPLLRAMDLEGATSEQDEEVAVLTNKMDAMERQLAQLTELLQAQVQAQQAVVPTTK